MIAAQCRGRSRRGVAWRGVAWRGRLKLGIGTELDEQDEHSLFLPKTESHVAVSRYQRAQVRPRLFGTIDGSVVRRTDLCAFAGGGAHARTARRRIEPELESESPRRMCTCWLRCRGVDSGRSKWDRPKRGLGPSGIGPSGDSACKRDRPA